MKTTAFLDKDDLDRLLEVIEMMFDRFQFDMEAEDKAQVMRAIRIIELAEYALVKT